MKTCKEVILLLRGIIARKKTPIIIFLFIFIYLLMQMRCWIGFQRVTLFYSYFLFVILGFSYITGIIRFTFKRRYFVIAILFLAMYYYTWGVWHMNVFGVIECTIQVVNIFIIISIPDEDKGELLRHFVKWFGFIVGIGLIVYFITLFIQLPSLGVIEGDYGAGESSDRFFINYVFLLTPIEIVSGIVRFRGPFMEPGDLGCVSAFFLFATQFRFKDYKYLWVIFTGLMVSLSLAGYVLAIVGLLFTLFANHKIRKKYALIIVVIVVALFSYGLFYNNGDNIINEEIIARLQSDEDRGFTGNNRTSLTKMAYFANMFDNTHTLWFGYDEKTIEFLNEEKSGDGFVTYAIQFGLFGMTLMILPYLYTTFSSSKKRYASQFLLIFLLFFFQRASVEWIAYIICFVNGIVVEERESLGKSFLTIKLLLSDKNRN